MIYTVITKTKTIKDVDVDYELKKGEEWHLIDGKQAVGKIKKQKRLV